MERIFSFTRGIDGALMESSLIPIAIKIAAALGSLAISPHIPTQILLLRADSIVSLMRRRTAGLK